MNPEEPKEFDNQAFGRSDREACRRRGLECLPEPWLLTSS